MPVRMICIDDVDASCMMQAGTGRTSSGSDIVWETQAEHKPITSHGNFQAYPSAKY